jgi:hypothetical protein
MKQLWMVVDDMVGGTLAWYVGLVRWLGTMAWYVGLVRAHW